MELSKPNAIMNRWMNLISQRCGLSTEMESTRSVAMVISGKSVNRLVSKICFGNRGRNGRNKEAPAILNILPKLALVAMKIYFMVLANVFLPATIPAQSTFRSWFRSTISAASLATSTAESTEMPTSAVCKAGASLMPSPIMPVVLVRLRSFGGVADR